MIKRIYQQLDTSVVTIQLCALLIWFCHTCLFQSKKDFCILQAKLDNYFKEKMDDVIAPYEWRISEVMVKWYVGTSIKFRLVKKCEGNQTRRLY